MEKATYKKKEKDKGKEVHCLKALHTNRRAGREEK